MAVPRARAVTLAAALVAALLAGGCGSESSGGAASTSTTQAGDVTVYTVDSAGFSIAVPNDWTGIDAEVGDDILAQEAEKNPALQPLVDALQSGQGGIQLIAAAPEPAEGFTANANVVTETVPAGFTIDQVLEGNLNTIESVFGVRPDGSMVTLPAGDAAKMVWSTTANGQTVERLQYLLLDGTTAYTLTFTSTAAQGDAYDEVFQQSAESFRLL